MAESESATRVRISKHTHNPSSPPDTKHDRIRSPAPGRERATKEFVEHQQWTRAGWPLRSPRRAGGSAASRPEMSTRRLPDWAIEPVDMHGASLVLGISRRSLVELLKKYPVYERRGSKKVFYPEHIEALRE